MTEDAYRYRGHRWLQTVILSVIVVGGLSLALWFGLTDRHSVSPGEKEGITVYCAAGVRPPVEEAAREFTEELGIPVRLSYGSSGELEGKIRLEAENGTSRCDLYIPADHSFAERAREKELVRELISIAAFQLVLGVKPGNPAGIETLEDVLRDDVAYMICNEKAGVGKMTRQALERNGLWAKVLEGAKGQKARVTEAASDVQTSEAVDAAFIWDATAYQYGLDIVRPAELAGATATITAAVTAASTSPTAALRFARYLAAPERGQPLFEEHRFQRVDGDAWAEVPRLLVFSGGVNRHAVESTLADFEAREGCEIRVMYAGCGTLVQAIEAGEQGLPDTFLTCDASYLGMVQDRFGPPKDVSATDMVMVVRAGNEKEIEELSDLGRPDVMVGLADPEKSALGALSVALLEQAGVMDRVKPKMRTAPTAHELFMMMESNTQKMDVVIVYVANCQQMSDKLEIVPIRHPGARAVQNIAVGKNSRHSQLAARLMEAILSEQSRARFTTNGFSWLADTPPERP